jgi:hypothetical protein
MDFWLGHFRTNPRARLSVLGVPSQERSRVQIPAPPPFCLEDLACGHAEDQQPGDRPSPSLAGPNPRRHREGEQERDRRQEASKGVGPEKGPLGC